MSAQLWQHLLVQATGKACTGPANTAGVQVIVQVAHIMSVSIIRLKASADEVMHRCTCCSSAEGATC